MPRSARQASHEQAIDLKACWCSWASTTGRSDAAWCRERILKTNFWADENGRPWKHSVASLKLDVLCVSQFTLYGELKRKKGRGNLDWRHAMGPEPAKAFYEAFLSDLRGCPKVPNSPTGGSGR